MKFQTIIFRLVLFLLIVLSSCQTNDSLVVKSSSPALKYSGRIDSSGRDLVNFFWSGTGVELNFAGTDVDVFIQDESGDNYYTVILDEDSTFIFRPTTKKKYHTLVSGLSGKKHHIKLFKNTEYDRGKTSFFGFRISGNPELLSRPATKSKKMEFYGNSITAGYAVTDYSGNDSPDGIFTNHYLSYAALTARHFDADYHCICKSGIGITISWFPQIMPEIYNRLDPREPDSRWNFDLFKPDIVVINLFQNDSWLINMPEHEQFKARFNEEKPTEQVLIHAYKNFVYTLRSHYPDAHIICVLGPMDATREESPWPGYIERAVESLDDSKIYTHFIPYKNTPGHPRVEEQKVIAQRIIEFISDTIGW